MSSRTWYLGEPRYQSDRGMNSSVFFSLSTLYRFSPNEPTIPLSDEIKLREVLPCTGSPPTWNAYMYPWTKREEQMEGEGGQLIGYVSRWMGGTANLV